MVHEFIEALKREFWPKEEDSDSPPSASEQKKEEGPVCDYCGDSIKTRAYRLHDKLICSPCLNERYDSYTAKTFQKITNKSLEDVRKKI